MELQIYAILGIAATGIIFNEVLEYKRSQMIGYYAGRFQEFAKQAQRVNSELDNRFSKLFKTIDNKLINNNRI